MNFNQFMCPVCFKHIKTWCTSCHHRLKCKSNFSKLRDVSKWHIQDNFIYFNNVLFFKVTKSPIHGKGLFAARDFPKKFIIGVYSTDSNNIGTNKKVTINDICL